MVAQLLKVGSDMKAKKLTKAELTVFKKKLQERQIQLTKQLAGDLNSLVSDQDSDDYGELAQESMAFEVNAGLSENAAEELSNIKDALEQIETGEYGMCSICDKPIAVARLHAIPFVKTCLKCQSELEG